MCLYELLPTLMCKKTVANAVSLLPFTFISYTHFFTKETTKCIMKLPCIINKRVFGGEKRWQVLIATFTESVKRKTCK